MVVVGDEVSTVAMVVVVAMVVMGKGLFASMTLSSVDEGGF